MTALLTLDRITKRFGTAPAVDDLTLEIRENEFFALLGASGSGKTTVLRMLAGFEVPTSGRILLAGQDITATPPNRRPLNLMFQSYALFPHMTVRANIAYGLEMERLPRAEIASRVDDILGIVALTPYADRKPDQLSGGQRQRVALARALVKRPRVLLLDEPLAALDKKLREAMQLELKRLQHEVGTTFVVVTHDQEEALVMADRIAILKDGRLVQCAPPREVYEHPASRYAAEFIGGMNLFHGQMAAGVLRLSDGTAISAATTLPPGPGIAAVRPERLQLGAGENTLQGRLTAIAYHGQDVALHIATPLSDRPVMLRLPVGQVGATLPETGQTVTFGWAARDTRLFPA
jgi:spermidine/putrescine ABC transporter ATP-binding subunit